MSTAPVVNAERGHIVINGGHFISQSDTPDAVGISDLIPLAAIAVDALHTSAQRYPPPKCHPGTRDAVLGVIDTWMRARSADPICWLHGTAGVGKSAILQTICESSMGENGPVFAAFFFGRGQGRRALSQYLIPTLAHQLAQTNESYRPRLQKTLEKNGDVFRKAIPAQMRTLLVRPLSDTGGRWFKRFKGLLSLTKRPIVVVIDGLDECDGEENQATIVKSLAETASAVKQPLRFLIASRPESHILKAFNQISRQTKRVRLDNSFKPDDAIRLYLVDQFGSIVRDSADTLSHTNLTSSWPGEAVINILVVAACGQFIFASLVIAFIKTPHTDPLQQLEIVLDAARNHVAFSPLDSLYLHILGNVSTHLQTTLKKTLVCLVALAEPQTVDVVADILSIDETNVRLVLEQLRAVLRTDSETGALFDHPITFAHASFRDFLIDPYRSGSYTIDIIQAHNVILARLSSPDPPSRSSRLGSNQSIRPRARYAIDYNNISYHVPHLSLTSVPISIALDPLDLTTFHKNLISFFDCIGHPALDAVYLFILNNVKRSRQRRVRKALRCLAVLARPQTVNVIANFLNWRVPDVNDILEDIKPLLHRPDAASQSTFGHPIIAFSHTSFQHFLTDPARSKTHTVDLWAAHNWILIQMSNNRGTKTPARFYIQDTDIMSHHLPHFSFASIKIQNRLKLFRLTSNLVSFFEDYKAIQALDSVYQSLLHNVSQHLQPTLKDLLPCLAVLASPQVPEVIADLISCDPTELAPIGRSLRVAFSPNLQKDIDKAPTFFPRDSFRDFLTNPQQCQEYAVDPKRAHSVILAQLSRPPITPSDADSANPPKMAYAPFFTHHLPHLSLSKNSSFPHYSATTSELHSNLLSFFEHMGCSEGFDFVYLHCLNITPDDLRATVRPILASLVDLPDRPTTKDIATAACVPEEDVKRFLGQFDGIIDWSYTSTLVGLLVVPPSLRTFLRDRQRAGVYYTGV